MDKTDVKCMCCRCCWEGLNLKKELYEIEGPLNRRQLERGTRCICKENLHFRKYLNEKQIVVEAVIYIYKAPAKYKETTCSNFRNF